MASKSQARSVGVYLYVTRRDGTKADRVPVTSHDEAWTTAMALARSPEVQQVAARIG
jgi:hypothetical protein